MKKQNYNFMRSLFLICSLICASFLSMAQEQSSVEINTDLPLMSSLSISENGRYVIGSGEGNADMELRSFFWDRQEDILYKFPRLAELLEGVSIDGLAVGSYCPDHATQKFYPGTWDIKTKTWTRLPVTPECEQAKGTGNATCITGDGMYIGGFIYVPQIIAGASISQTLLPIVWKKDGSSYKIHKVYKTLMDGSGQGSRINDISEDGQTICGWTSYGYWIPTIWKGDEIIHQSKPHGMTGYFSGLNSDGTIACGSASGMGSEACMWEENGQIEKAPGASSLADVADNGLMVGRAVYSKDFGARGPAGYLKEFYGLDFPAGYYIEFFYRITKDAKYITGTCRAGSVRYPFVVELAKFPKPSIPRNIATSLNMGTTEVTVSWDTPVFNGHHPIGYNVYRDGNKLNATTIASSIITYIDINMPIGKSCYTVTAVYDYEGSINESDKSKPSCIEVVGEDGCYSPKGLALEVVYNKTVNLSWKEPNPNYKSGETKENSKLALEFVKMWQLNTNIELYPAYTNFSATDERIRMLDTGVKNSFTQIINYGFHSYDFYSGAYKNKVTYGSVSAARGLTNAYDSLYINNKSANGEFLSIGNNRGHDYVNKSIDFHQTRITYVSTLFNGTGGFEIGTGSKSKYISKDFKQLTDGLNITDDVFDMAYFNGKLYGAIRSDNVEDGVVNPLIIKVYDVATGVATGEYIDVRDYVEHLPNVVDTTKIGGLTVVKTNEVHALAVVLRNPTKNELLFLQLASATGELAGYDLYRNDVKINNELLKKTTYTEELTTPGEYTYEVKAVYDGTCVSNASEPVSVTIKPLGTCNPPQNLKIEWLREYAYVTWEAPENSSTHTLIGYNLYGNGKKYNIDILKDTHWLSEAWQYGNVTYAVEAFYDNSCVSEKVQLTSIMGGFSPVVAPANIAVKTEDDSAIVSWDTPAIGDFDVKRWYNGGSEWEVGLDNGGDMYVGCKWESKDLKFVHGYTLTDIEFFPAMNLRYTFTIYIDDRFHSEQVLESVSPGKYNLLKLENPVTIRRKGVGEYQSVFVVCKVTHAKKQYPIGADKQVGIDGKGNLLSTDGINWVNASTHGLKANWAISIVLRPYSLPSLKNESVNESETMNFNFDAINDINISGKATRAKEESLFVNDEVIGYNVYQGNKMVNSSMINDNQYSVVMTNPEENNCYSVEAVFTRERVSSKSGEVCTFDNCGGTNNLKGQYNINNHEVELAWTEASSASVNKIEFKKHHEIEEPIGIAFVQNFTFYALLQMTVADMSIYDNLTLKSLKAFIAGSCDYKLVVIQGGKVVYEQKPDAIVTGNNAMIDIDNDGFVVDVKEDLLVGLYVKAKAQIPSVGIDAGPIVESYRSDIISIDGKELQSISLATGGKLPVNWRMSMVLEEKGENSSELVEYNVYRDGVKVATAKEPLFIDKTVAYEQNYNYHVTALWSSGCESKESNSEIITTGPSSVDDLNAGNITVFPNPAKNRVNIRGEYNALRIYNSAGVILLDQNTKSDYIDLNGLLKGIYIIEFMSDNQIVNRTKLVVTK